MPCPYARNPRPESICSYTGRLRELLLVALFLIFSSPLLPAQGPSSSSGQDIWWKHAVIYEIYPRSFQDSNGDGIGDLNGITARLDYLQKLGVDAIWIAPMYPSPQVDFGYDISDYQAVDPQYGTLADFDRLIAEGKKHNIRVVLDMVLNHTSDKHQWFIDAASSRTNPKHDWYVWNDGVPADGPDVTAYQKRLSTMVAFRPTTGFRCSAAPPGSGFRPCTSSTITSSTSSSPT